MTITAIIAEYNPFHLGHKYHIEQARRLTNADIILVIMSGNLVQRGEPAIFDKHLRAKIAVDCGADMVIELPYPYSCSSAEYFAEAAITILHKLGCVDYLCFGSECNSTPLLYDIARCLVNETASYKIFLKNRIKEGMAYPRARHLALMNELKDKKYEPILTSPNNILGIEYIKSLIKLNINIQPITIERIVSNYHHNENNNPYYSASSIRYDYSKGYFDMDKLASISKLYISRDIHPIELNDYNSLLALKLIENRYILDSFLDVSSDLSDRIKNNINKYIDFSSFIQLLKTKNTNYSSISRALCHIMHCTTKADMYSYKSQGYADYARVLYMNNNAIPVISKVNSNNKFKLITKLSKADETFDMLPIFNKHIFEKNMLVDDIYRMVTQVKHKQSIHNEYQYKIKE